MAAASRLQKAAKCTLSALPRHQARRGGTAKCFPEDPMTSALGFQEEIKPDRGGKFS